MRRPPVQIVQHRQASSRCPFRPASATCQSAPTWTRGRGALVRARWEAARAGPRRCLLVSGEPGIGKTQFVTRAAREFHASGGLVLFGRCTEELAAPYGPWIQLLSPFVENASTEVLTAYVERAAVSWRDLFRRWRDGCRRPRRRARRIQSLSGTCCSRPSWGCSNVRARWRQSCSYSMTCTGLIGRPRAPEDVVVETSGMPMLILATYRDSDLAEDHPLTAVLADLHREERVERVRLPGLAEDEVASLLETAADHDGGMGNGVARQISAETDGNPFFVWELIRHLSESGFLARASEGGVSTLNLNELGLPRACGRSCFAAWTVSARISVASVLRLGYRFALRVRIAGQCARRRRR